MKNRDKQIYEKINSAVRLLCDVYELLNEEYEEPTCNENKYDFLTIKDFCEKHTFISVASIRDKIYRNPNDFVEKCTSKIGKRIYIREHAFFEWMNEIG